ncbi:hypothetical protein JR316_0007051 [Psilocybe cubensis]|uniref:Uncharacterized protein n=2 Tax=Psilocybe cubensis TaxID=181762 RepID=A0ACB8GY08_PSICU|nr:hypothetical protein JR316_0007051 [Psilocybe cubensis]KAH9480451.1 hypothetical protein JR316_0007051 [Psilocybe cubensis]
MSYISSTREALTTALKFAKQAVELDSSTDSKPNDTIAAYSQAIMLLSEALTRIRSKVDGVKDVSAELELRRLQNVHDTYADRMATLSVIYDIPVAPISSSSSTTLASLLTSSTSSSHSSNIPRSLL